VETQQFQLFCSEKTGKSQNDRQKLAAEKFFGPNEGLLCTS
jgi:hypothetical protein